MALVKTNIGTGPDGRPLFHYAQVDSDAPVVVTGPVAGTVETADGTVYDVTAPVIEVDSAVHAGEVAHAIAVQLEAEGHPDHDAAVPFTHECTDDCGGLGR